MRVFQKGQYERVCNNVWTTLQLFEPAALPSVPTPGFKGDSSKLNSIL
jgi:hypothetical protein